MLNVAATLLDDSAVNQAAQHSPPARPVEFRNAACWPVSDKGTPRIQHMEVHLLLDMSYLLCYVSYKHVPCTSTQSYLHSRMYTTTFERQRTTIIRYDTSPPTPHPPNTRRAILLYFQGSSQHPPLSLNSSVTSQRSNTPQDWPQPDKYLVALAATTKKIPATQSYTWFTRPIIQRKKCP